MTNELMIGGAASVLNAASRSTLAAVCVAPTLDGRLRAALERLAANPSQVPVLAVQPEDADLLRNHYQLSKTATLLFLRRGAEVGRLVGLDSEARMKLALECALEAPPGAEAMREEASFAST